MHHSAPARGGNLSSPGSVPGELQRIQRYHMEQTSPRCGDIGYHFLIDPWGEVYEGRELAWQGAHAGGVNNHGNIGICLLGNFEATRPSSAALESLERLLDELTAKYRIQKSESRILGHGELKTTVCPGRGLMAWVERYRS